VPSAAAAAVSSESGIAKTFSSLAATNSAFVPGVAVTSTRSPVSYLSMFVQPVLVYEADRVGVRRAYERAMGRGVTPAVYTYELFTTNHDEANRAAVAAVPADELDLVGVAFRAERKTVDKIVDRLRLHP
jgi:hypothetical protein